MYIKTSFITWPPELLRLNGRGGLGELCRLGDERADGIGRLRAVLYPVSELIRVDGDLFLVFGGLGIVMADNFKRFAVRAA
jgi:hypothetical protein